MHVREPSGYRLFAALRAGLSAGDPRPLQILALSLLLGYGIVQLGFELNAMQMLATFAGALGAHWMGRLWHAARPRHTWPSAVITALSLCLLLRVDQAALGALAGFLAVGSKFVLRVRGKHLFNPATFGIAVMLLCYPGSWVSPGQWGRVALLGLAMTGLALCVLTRARRLDISATFLIGYAGLLCARALYLGDPFDIVVHQLQSGALLLFAFFMISDPRSTPDTRAGRLILALCVAMLAAWLQFQAYRSDALILALALCAPLTPMLDAWLQSASGCGPPDARLH